MKHLIIGFCVVLVLIGNARCDSWTSSVDLLQPRTGAAVVQLSQTSFAVIGGLSYVNSTDPLASVEVFDTISQTWNSSVIPPLPIGLCYASAAFDQSRNSIWVVGGYTIDFQLVPYLYKFNFTSSGWFQQASMPSSRAGHVVLLINGVLYVFGGLGNSSYEAQTLAYSPIGDIWESRGSLQYPRAFLAGVVSSANQAYLIGGRNPDHLKVVERYSVTADAFEQLPSMPSRRSGISAAVVQNRIMVFGGIRDNILNTTEEYNINEETWFCRTGMNISRENSNAVALGSAIYVVGGETSQNVTGAMELYTIASSNEAGYCPVFQNSASRNDFWTNMLVTVLMLVVCMLK